MKYLGVVILSLGIIGCQQVTINHGKLFFVDGHYVHQWVYEDGTDCGTVQGFKGWEGDSTFLATPADVGARHNFYVRYEDAYKYMVHYCPGATTVKIEKPSDGGSK